MTERQYQPSARRLRRARADGKIIKSQLVSNFAGFIVLCFSLGPSLSWVRDGSLIHWLNYKVWGPKEALVGAARDGFFSILCVLLPVAVAVVSAGLAQTRGSFLASQLTKGFKNFQPGTYLSRIRQNVVEASAGLGRTVVIATVLLPTLAGLFLERCCSSFLPGVEQLDDWLGISQCVVGRATIVLFGLAALSYALVRWRYFRGLKMSLQELKDEHREEEGDPNARTARKREYATMMLSEIEKRVRRSKVIIVSRGPRLGVAEGRAPLRAGENIRT